MITKQEVLKHLNRSDGYLNQEDIDLIRKCISEHGQKTYTPEEIHQGIQTAMMLGRLGNYIANFRDFLAWKYEVTEIHFPNGQIIYK